MSGYPADIWNMASLTWQACRHLEGEPSEEKIKVISKALLSVRNMKNAERLSAMTVKQRDMLGFIQSYTAENQGVAPTIREMRDWAGLASMSGVYRLVEALEERGFIRRLENRARSIVVIGVSA